MSPNSRIKAATRARMRRLVRSGGLRKALLSLAAADEGRDMEDLDFGGSAELVAGLVELDNVREEAGTKKEVSVLASFLRRFIFTASATKDDSKSVEKQAELSHAGNDKCVCSFTGWACI